MKKEDKERLEEFKALPPYKQDAIRQGLKTLLWLTGKEVEDKVPMDVVDSVLDSVREIINKDLSVAVLFAAAEWAEKQEDDRLWVYSKAFDWIRHVLEKNDVEQMPLAVDAITELFDGKQDIALEFADLSGGIDEFNELYRIWKETLG